MIAVCVPFYPWYREHDRSDELFDVLIASMMKMKDRKYLSLSISDGGIKDVWGRKRTHDVFEFAKRLQKAWDGKLYYFADDLVKDNRWHLAQAVENAVMQSSEPYLFLIGIDFYLPEGFVDLYFKRVNSYTCWVPFAYNILRGVPLEIDPKMKVGNWHTARGIVGITRINYLKVGGYPVEYIKDRSDSNFYLRIRKEFTVDEGKCEGLFHVAHPGSHASRKWRIDQ